MLRRIAIEIDIDCSYEISPGCIGARGKYGLQIDPDCEPELSIRSVTDTRGNKISLTKNEMEKLRAEIWRIENQQYYCPA